MYKYVLLFLISCLVTTAITRVVQADYQAPSFPTCPNPGGTVIANYENGQHGIPGQQSSVDGSDTVYALDSDMAQVVQCYCPVDMFNGTQTNWLDVKNISDDDKASLEAKGWIFEPDGSAWGLAADPYMAYNEPISCGFSQPTITPTPASGTITAVVQSADQTNNSSSPSSNTPQSLPYTGGSIEFFFTILVGLMSVVPAIIFKKLAQ